MAVAPQKLAPDGSRRARPWSFRLFDQLPTNAAISGLVLGLLVLAVYAVFELLTGRPQALLRGEAAIDVGCEFLPGDYRIGVVGIILLMYSTTARYVLERWTLQAEHILKQDNFLTADMLAAQRWWGFIPGLVGFAICFGLAVDIAERDIEWTSDYWILPHAFNWLWCVPFGWVGGRLVYSLIVNAVLVSRAARTIEVDDLDDTVPLDAAVRHGTRSALLSIVFLGLVSVHFVDPGFGIGAAIFVVTMFIVGAIISTLPAMGVVQVLYDKRDEQLEELRREIEIEEQQLRDKDPDYEPGRIGDIVALEQRLRSWQVSLFRFSTFARLMLYAVAGFLSWLFAETISVIVEGMFGF